MAFAVHGSRSSPRTACALTVRPELVEGFFEVRRESTVTVHLVGRLTADGGNRDMRHRRIRLGAMPVPLTGLDVHDVTDRDFALFLLRCDDPRAGSDN
jgi:hypothetical protein